MTEVDNWAATDQGERRHDRMNRGIAVRRALRALCIVTIRARSLPIPGDVRLSQPIS